MRASSRWLLPQSNNAYMGRWLILVGGYQFSSVYYPNGTLGPLYGVAQRMCPSAINATVSTLHFVRVQRCTCSLARWVGRLPGSSGLYLLFSH